MWVPEGTSFLPRAQLADSLVGISAAGTIKRDLMLKRLVQAHSKGLKEYVKEKLRSIFQASDRDPFPTQLLRSPSSSRSVVRSGSWLDPALHLKSKEQWESAT
ncbi:hypothetical protein PMIN06_005547 [Paraphaeosphaeria minitans]